MPAENTVPAAVAVCTALGDPLRMRAVQEIFLSGPMTALPLGERLGANVKKMSRHLQHLRDAGVLEQGYGRVYKIPDRFLVAGQRLIDFGHIVLRIEPPH
jgi:hypothetical protein